VYFPGDAHALLESRTQQTAGAVGSQAQEMEPSIVATTGRNCR
jgi:hypothetical protein